jgi:hypothetical protein
MIPPPPQLLATARPEHHRRFRDRWRALRGSPVADHRRVAVTRVSETTPCDLSIRGHKHPTCFVCSPSQLCMRPQVIADPSTVIQFMAGIRKDGRLNTVWNAGQYERPWEPVEPWARRHATALRPLSNAAPGSARRSRQSTRSSSTAKRARYMSAMATAPATEPHRSRGGRRCLWIPPYCPGHSDRSTRAWRSSATSSSALRPAASRAALGRMVAPPWKSSWPSTSRSGRVAPFSFH